MAPADCPHHISLKWKLAEISELFPEINESDLPYCAEAACGCLSDAHAGVRQVNADKCEESGKEPCTLRHSLSRPRMLNLDEFSGWGKNNLSRVT